jgi:hypothetical protein
MELIVDGWQAFQASGFGGAVTSVEAQRIYAWTALALTYAVSLVAAQRQLGLLKGVRAVELESDEKLSGPIPTRPQTIRDRLQRYRDRRATIIGGIWQALGGLVVLGLVVPGGVVFCSVWLHDWLLPDYARPILVDGGGSGAPAFGEIGVFLIDQIFRGALADVPEVFRLGLTPISNNPENAVISWMIVIYRIAAGAVTAAAGYMIYRVWRGMPNIDRWIRFYEDRLQRAEAGQFTGEQS